MAIGLSESLVASDERRRKAFRKGDVRSGSVVSGVEIISVRVKPGSRKGPLVEAGVDTDLTIYLPERAVDGKANAAVSRLLAEHLGVPRARVTLVAGATGRLKRFRVLR
ncbi:hypothetical protein MSIMFI_03278 [Mycobacterium simulans]|nr:hypothetical protein MSIMFI_03278 [Mycobacterium simulans]